MPIYCGTPTIGRLGRQNQARSAAPRKSWAVAGSPLPFSIHFLYASVGNTIQINSRFVRCCKNRPFVAQIPVLRPANDRPTRALKSFASGCTRQTWAMAGSLFSFLEPDKMEMHFACNTYPTMLNICRPANPSLCMCRPNAPVGRLISRFGTTLKNLLSPHSACMDSRVRRSFTRQICCIKKRL
jgi:hypothetical protein